MYKVKRFSWLSGTWLGEGWRALKNNVRYWWKTPGKKAAIARGEDPREVKGFWANYRPHWNSLKDALLLKYATPAYLMRAHMLMEDHDERRATSEGKNFSEVTGQTWRFPQGAPPMATTQQQPTAKELQEQQFQLQKELLQTQRQRAALLEQQRRDRLREAENLQKASQQKDSETTKSQVQGQKASQEAKKSTGASGQWNNSASFRQKSQTVVPKGMDNGS